MLSLVAATTVLMAAITSGGGSAALLATLTRAGAVRLTFVPLIVPLVASDNPLKLVVAKAPLTGPLL